MIILDTNVVSELIRRQPDAAVVAWLDAQPSGDVATTAITVAELLYGVARLPRGRRKEQLAQAISDLVHDDLRGRVHPFAADSAERYAMIVSARERLGRPISVLDAQIAAICDTHGAHLATRNTRDFIHTGVDVVDPWTFPTATA
jgi:predicted nucleic acid-binding protein